MGMRYLSLVLLSLSLFASENNSLEVKTLSGNHNAFFIGGEENLIVDVNNDNARTFALTSAYEWDKNRILVSYDMLTYVEDWGNGTPTYKVLRTDRLDGIYTRKIGEDSAYIRVGAGFRYYGDIGGASSQLCFHKNTNDGNPPGITDQDYRNYEDMKDLALVGQVSFGGIYRDEAGFFANINADASSSKEVNVNGYCGAHIYKTFFIGPYFQSEYNTMSKTVDLINNDSSLDENNAGIRLSLSYQNVQADMSFAFSGMGHCRLGFSF